MFLSESIYSKNTVPFEFLSVDFNFSFFDIAPRVEFIFLHAFILLNSSLTLFDFIT